MKTKTVMKGQFEGSREFFRRVPEKKDAKMLKFIKRFLKRPISKRVDI